MEEKKEGNAAEAVESPKEGKAPEAAGSPQAFAFTVSDRGGGEDGIAAKLEVSGSPASGAEMEAVPVRAAARALAFLYDAALVGSGREDTVTERAMFLASMQPQLLRTFLGLAESWQFQKALAEHRELARKAKAEKKDA